MGCLRAQPAAVPYAVGLIITAGYWFTASTSFANPAVTIARSLTDSFAGIRPLDVARIHRRADRRRVRGDRPRRLAMARARQGSPE